MPCACWGLFFWQAARRPPLPAAGESVPPGVVCAAGRRVPPARAAWSAPSAPPHRTKLSRR
eukprot:scaffold4063_cov119-Isochrysis_galbana.AAC.3